MPASDETGDSLADNIPAALLNVFIGCFSVYALLFGVGYSVYGRYVPALALLVIGSAGVGFLVRNLRKHG
jgi:hypothetical protein